MTEDEQHAEIGRSFEERRAARRELKCVDSKLGRLRDDAFHALEAAGCDTPEAPDEEPGWIVEETDSGRQLVGISDHDATRHVYPHPDDLIKLLERRRELVKRLHHLDEFLKD